MAQTGNGTVQSVRRAMTLLGLFTPSHRWWSISDLTRASGIPKSVVARLMTTMAIDGFVVQDPSTRRYAIGPQAFALGAAYEPHAILDRTARPIMLALTERSGQACVLGVPAGNEFMYLIVIETPRSTPIRVTVDAGGRRPYHATPIGKVLLAGMPDEQVHAILSRAPLTSLTPYTKTSLEEIQATIEEIRQTRLAQTNQESIIGVGALAAPIINADGEWIAALSSVYAIRYIDDDELAELSRLTQDAAAQISQHLGALTLGESPRFHRGCSPHDRLLESH